MRHVSGGWENFFDVFPTWKLQLSENFWKLKVATHVADFVMSDLKLFLFFLFLWKNYTKLIFNGRIFLKFVWSWKQPERGQKISFIKGDFRLREFKLKALKFLLKEKFTIFFFCDLFTNFPEIQKGFVHNKNLETIDKHHSSNNIFADKPFTASKFAVSNKRRSNKKFNLLIKPFTFFNLLVGPNLD